ncbi:hypothetical protein MASR2M69_06480 [Bacteroidota bacterium]
MMDKEIYPMKEMGDYFNPKFVSVKFNAEKGEEGPAVKKKFELMPTLLSCNSWMVMEICSICLQEEY